MVDFSMNILSKKTNKLMNSCRWRLWTINCLFTQSMKNPEEVGDICTLVFKRKRAPEAFFVSPSNHWFKSALNSDKSLLLVVRTSKIGLICMSFVKQLLKASVYLDVLYYQQWKTISSGKSIYREYNREFLLPTGRIQNSKMKHNSALTSIPHTGSKRAPSNSLK